MINNNLNKTIERLEVLKGVLYSNANKHPTTLKDLLNSGKQQAYSHIYFEVENIVELQKKKDLGYINWKVINLVLGFCVGAMFTLYALNKA